MADRPILRTAATAAVATSIIVAGTACGSETSSGPQPTQTSGGSASTSGFIGFIEPLSGTNGRVSYRVDLPALRGGEAAVRDRFNSEMRAAFDAYVKPPEHDDPVTIAPGRLGGQQTSQVTHIGSGAVAGILLVSVFAKHAAHPFTDLSTTVIDARTAQPITVTDLFDDTDTGLAKLAAVIATQIAANTMLAGQPPPEPMAEQLAQWLPSADGLIVYVPVAHVLGDYYPITVAWDDLAGLLAPRMREKLST